MINKVIAGHGVRKTGLEIARGICAKLLREDSSYSIAGKLVLNWGKSDAEGLPGYADATFLNTPSAVSIASSKIATLGLIGEEFSVACTTEHATACAWAEHGGVMGRDLDRGYGGRGITVYAQGDTIGTHRFYTKYFKARDEYRIHVGKKTDGTYAVIDCQRKSLRQDDQRPDTPQFAVRNHENGFIFERGVDVPAIVKAVSMGAISTIGLDFGAVDIKHNASSNEVKVLEINTAPGLTGTTLENYINFFGEHYA